MDFLAEVSMRSLFLSLFAMAALWAFRVKSASARHSVWTLVTVGMLLLAALNPLLPPIPLRILKAGIPPIVFEVKPVATPIAPVSIPVVENEKWKLSANQIIFAVYLIGATAFLARLLFGYILTRRLVGQAILPAATFQAALPAAEFRESRCISSPMTTGWIRPKVLLPITWREWDPPKLQAVLTHELAHVRRADALVATLAALNRTLFWFHPLAWWLERHLASLAEQACDDSALLTLGNREQYARTLLDMAAAVNSAQGRLIWPAISMAESWNVGRRIERILDETRIIPTEPTRLRRLAMTFCSLPLLYAISVLQLAPRPVMGQEARVTLPAYDDPSVQWLIQGNQMTSADVGRLEGDVASNPQNLAARGKLIAYYYQHGPSLPRLVHIRWLIEHRPESELTGFASAGISPRNSTLNDLDDYQRTRSLWLRQTARFPKDSAVLSNAVRFFAQPGGDSEEAERLIKRGRTLEPQNPAWTSRLASLYTSVIVEAAVSGYAGGNPLLAARIKSDMDKSSDRALMEEIANRLKSLEPLFNRIPGLRESPEIKSLFEFGKRLSGFSTIFVFAFTSYDHEPPETGPRPPPTIRRVRYSPGAPVMKLVERVEPVYPAVAIEERIQGTVRFHVTIGTDGRVSEIQLVEGNPVLVAAAHAAVSQWVYEPRLLREKPVEVETDVEVAFELDKPAI